MKILGIDPGVERVGIAIVEKNGSSKESLIYSECFKTSAKLSHATRLAHIGERIAAVINEHSPRGLAIEKLYFETNVTTAMSVSEARGVVLYEAARAGLSIYEYTPLQIKAAVTGYGKGDKKAIARMVPLLIALPDRAMLDDEIDAIAVGLTCFASERLEK